MGRKHGFTLIELSIVIVIIGLLVGGILVGRDLIRASEIRAQISQIEEFKTATNTFKVKYGYLPGDMPPSQASQLGFFTFTGAKAGQGCTATGKAFGNGDGIINSSNEYYPFWSHLSDSKLIKGSYGGTVGNLLVAAAASCASNAGNPSTFPTTDSGYAQFYPRAKIASANAFIDVYGNRFSAPNPYNILYSYAKKDNIFIIRPISGYVMSANQAYQIDSKIDDSLPASGNVMDFRTADWGGRNTS